MKKNREIRQGDIYDAKLPNWKERNSVQRGKRPVVVVSTDWLNKNSPVYRVVPLTSRLKAIDMPTHVVLPKLKGLPKQSMVLAEQMSLLPQENFLRYRCTLSGDLYKEVDRAVRHSIRRKRHRHKNGRKHGGHRSHKKKPEFMKKYKVSSMQQRSATQ